MPEHTILGAVALTYGTVDQKCEDNNCAESWAEGGFHIHEVPALFLGDEPVWQGTKDDYWDRYGDGGPTILKVIADRLRKVLNA